MTRSSGREFYQNWRVQSSGRLLGSGFGVKMSQRILSRQSLLRRWFALIAVLAFACNAEAHRVSSVSLISYLDTVKRSYVLDVAMEVMPSEDQELNEEIPPEEAARQFAEEYLVVMFDRQDQKPDLEIHLENASDENTPPELTRQQVLAKLSGPIPDGAKEFLLYLDPNCPMAVVMVVVKDSQPSRRMQVILAGEYSRPVSVAPLSTEDPFAAGASDAPGERSLGKGEIEMAETSPEPDREGSAGSPFLAGARGFLIETDFMPVLLVVAMLLLSMRRRDVFVQSAVLLVTLSLFASGAGLKLLPVPFWTPVVLVVVILAFALESLIHQRLRSWRFPLLALGGGLAGLEVTSTGSFRTLFPGRLPDTTEMVSYVVGVEIAFLLVVVLTAVVLELASRWVHYRQWVVPPLAVLLSGYLLFSLIEVFL